MSAKLALISGGSRGLGEALCQQFAARDYTLIEFSRSAAASYSVAVDFAAPEDAARIFEATLAPLAAKPWDEIIVIHNAATLDPIGAVQDKPVAEVLANINTNVASAILFMRAVLTQFQAQACRKTLLNVSSGAAHKAYAGWSLYSAAKAASEAFVRGVAVEQALQAHPFVLLNVDPGVMDTAMQAAIRQSAADDFPEVARFIQRQAAGELRAPHVVAAAIARIVAAQPASGSRVAAADFLA
jgi:benzil reductase ((S)-benzoin forming)